MAKAPPRKRRLAFGGRVSGKSNNRDFTEYFEVVLGFSQELRTEVFNDFYDDVRKYALEALLESYATSTTSAEHDISTGSLYSSIKQAYDGKAKDKMTISVGEGKSAAYANVRDRKKGEYTPIAPQRYMINGKGPFLVFTLHRNARILPQDKKIFYPKPVMSPGSYFFTGSFKKAMRNVNRSISKWIKRYNEDFYADSIYKVDVQGRMIYRGGNKSMQQLKQSGRIDASGNIIRPKSNTGARRR